MGARKGTAKNVNTYWAYYILPSEVHKLYYGVYDTKVIGLKADVKGYFETDLTVTTWWDLYKLNKAIGQDLQDAYVRYELSLNPLSHLRTYLYNKHLERLYKMAEDVHLNKPSKPRKPQEELV